jgi:hypothetical protein
MVRKNSPGIPAKALITSGIMKTGAVRAHFSPLQSMELRYKSDLSIRLGWIPDCYLRFVSIRITPFVPLEP